MKPKILAMYILGGLIASGFFVLLGLLIFQAIPEQNNNVLYLAIGALISAFATVVGYFYGSSSGSADKNEMLTRKP